MKGKLAKLAYDFMKRGYIVYGWTSKDYGTKKEDEYAAIYIGKKEDSRIVHVYYDYFGMLVVSRVYKPSSEFGSACAMYSEEEDKVKVSVDLILKAFEDPIWVRSSKGSPVEYRDITAWEKANAKWNMYNKVEYTDLTSVAVREYLVSCINCEALGIGEDCPEEEKIDALLKRIYEEKADTWKRHGKKEAVIDYMRGLGSGLSTLAFETYRQRGMLKDWHVKFTDETIDKVFYETMYNALNW